MPKKNERQLNVSRPRVRGPEKVVDNVWLAGHLLVVHHGQDSHLRGTSVVKLDRALLKLGFLREALPLLLEWVDQ